MGEHNEDFCVGLNAKGNKCNKLKNDGVTVYNLGNTIKCTDCRVKMTANYFTNFAWINIADFEVGSSYF